MKTLISAGIVLAFTSGLAFAHGTETHSKKKLVPANLDPVKNEFGETGDPKSVAKVIKVKMNDEMKFIPDKITVKVGQTIKFVVENGGETLHEMVIGRHKDLLEHAALMEKFPNMEHSEPYMAHTAEGQTAEMFWKFTNAGTFEYGCLVPGHYQAGMKGTIIVTN